jgi:hypothetical protein
MKSWIDFFDEFGVDAHEIVSIAERANALNPAVSVESWVDRIVEVLRKYKKE